MTKQDEKETIGITTHSDGPDGRCSFCNRSRREVGRMVNGGRDHNRVAICSECAQLCAELLAEDEAGQ
jgi:hypothetical protein